MPRFFAQARVCATKAGFRRRDARPSTGSLLAGRMGGRVDLFEPADGDPRVDLRGLQLGVPKHGLDVADGRGVIGDALRPWITASGVP
jgi:hypothetical protein